jgi:hypothetical protein
MMPLWVQLLTMLIAMVGAGMLIAVSHRTGIPELVVIAVSLSITSAAVLVVVLRQLPASLGGGVGHPVRDWVILLAPWIATAVTVLAVAVLEWRRAKPARVAQADCSRCGAELYEDPTDRGRFYSANPFSYVCPQHLQYPGSPRRHDAVPRTAAVPR